ncbi:MAG: hypothetical protein LUD72_07910 [Bacteroidales bacterium]|nr:hypothetical protein [Bacteroidales bacterium]
MDFADNKGSGWTLSRKTLIGDLSVVDNELNKAAQELDKLKTRRNHLLRNLIGRTYVDVVSKSLLQKRYIKVTDITDSGRIVVCEVIEPCNNPKQGGGSGETNVQIDEITNPMLWEEVPNEDFKKVAEKVIDELCLVGGIEPREYSPLPELEIPML